jgi:hypothetical protein
VGQRWLGRADVARNHYNAFRQEEPGLIGVVTVPKFAIEQRALILRTPQGNILWDCLTLLDDATIDLIKGIGGISAIAISHPHYYGTMVEWSRAFGNAPIHLHTDDQRWVMCEDPAVRFWEGNTLDVAEGVTLVRCGGHFAGGTVLHWAQGDEGRGCLLAGDVVMVVPDRKYVSFMWSYPNLIPLSAPEVEQIGRALESFEFNSIYGPFLESKVMRDGNAVVKR